MSERYLSGEFGANFNDILMMESFLLRFRGDDCLESPRIIQHRIFVLTCDVAVQVVKKLPTFIAFLLYSLNVIFSRFCDPSEKSFFKACLVAKFSICMPTYIRSSIRKCLASNFRKGCLNNSKDSVIHLTVIGF